MRLRGLAAIFVALSLMACMSVTAFATIGGYVLDPEYTPFTPTAGEPGGSAVPDTYGTAATTTIADEAVPLGALPPLTTIVDENVPLADNPSTGVHMMVGRVAVFGAAAVGLSLVVGLQGRKKKEEK